MPTPNTRDRAAQLAARQRDEMLNPPEPPAGQPRVADPSRYVLSAEMLRLPSGRFEVMIDSWGSEPGLSGSRFVKGEIVSPEDAPQYDFGFARDQGVIRELNMAEARTLAPSTTASLTSDGMGIDPDLAEAGRFHAGFLSPDITGVLSDPDGQAVTVTGPSGPREPAEFAKPSLPAIDGAPPARPVIVAPEGSDTGSHAQVVRDYYADAEDSDAGQARTTGRSKDAERKARYRAKQRAKARANREAAANQAADQSADTGQPTQ